MSHLKPSPIRFGTSCVCLARQWVRPLLLTCALGWQLSAVGQQAQAPVSTKAANPSFLIRGFDIQGENPLPAGDVSKVLAPFLRADATIETLQKATAALESALRDRGFVLHRVALPPQEVGDTVTLNIVKFVIGKIAMDGQKSYSNGNIRASVPELVEGTAPNFRTLAVQTAIANENPGKQIQISLKESEQADKIDARILVKEAKPWNLVVNLSNNGSNATGNDRVTVAGGHNNLFDLDHQMTAAYTTSFERMSDVKQVGLNYRVPAYRQGGVFGLSYTHSDVVGDFGAFRSTGAGQTLGLNYNHYLAPSGGFRSYVLVALDDKQFNVTEINGIGLAGQAVRRSRPFSLGYNARLDSDTAAWSYSADLVVNLPGGYGNDLTSYQSEDTRITTARWTALRGSANYASSLSGGWLWSAKGQFQYSGHTLIAGEQFGIGGASSVRGTGERPISGDRGAFLSAEIAGPELAPGLRLIGFVDAGWLSNNNPNGNPKPAHDSLSSTGVGLRYSLPGFSLTAEYGRVINGSTLPFAVGSGLPQSGDQKLHISVSARF